MQIEHFLALIPLIILFIIGIKFRLFGLVHIINIIYSGILSYMSLVNSWEIALFLPICTFIAIVSLFLFIKSMQEGSWF